MNLRFSITDYTFPKLEWEQAVRLARDIGVQALDIGLFSMRSHLDPDEVFFDLPRSTARVRAAVGASDLEIADCFGQTGGSFQGNAVNHPNAAVRQKASEFFHRLLEFAVRCNAKHVTLLPGVHFEQESYEDSLKRCAGELEWRTAAARKMGITLGVEAHIGSIASTPAQAKRLMQLVPGLSLTLDYGHFTCQGYPDEEVEPLVAYASHFHARGACQGKLQASMKENPIGFSRILQAMKLMSYPGFVALEYVWVDWMRCNEVDNLSETILLRDFLRSVKVD